MINGDKAQIQFLPGPTDTSSVLIKKFNDCATLVSGQNAHQLVTALAKHIKGGCLKEL